MSVKDLITLRRLGVELSTWGLLALMAGGLMVSGFLFGGPILAMFALVLALVVGFGSEVLPMRWILWQHRARIIGPHELPGLRRTVEDLARRAGLPHAPALALVPSPICNAFAIRDDEQMVIGVTQGLLQRLPAGELSGVLAHEMSHLLHRDDRVMRLAAQFGRLSSLATQALFILLPLLLFGIIQASPVVLLALGILPLGQLLLQLAVSRQREFAADLRAAEILGSPWPLARALERLDQGRVRPWWMGPQPRPEQAVAWLQTHPPTSERVARLSELADLQQDGRRDRSRDNIRVVVAEIIDPPRPRKPFRRPWPYRL